MSMVGQVFLGWLISVIEILILIMFFHFHLGLKKLLWLAYSLTILTINIVPAILIAKGEEFFWVNSLKTIFSISSISAIISVLTLGLSIMTCVKIDDDCISSSCISHISVSVFVLLIITLISFTRTDNLIVEIETKTYENYYEIATENGESKVLYISLEDNTNGYYVVMYDSVDEDGKTKLNVVQISPQNVDIFYAFEGQEKDYLIVNTTEVIKEDRSKNPHEIITEKTHSYKLIIRKGVPIISVMPME